MGVCWQTTGDNSSKSKSVINNRLTSNLMISSSQNNNSSIHQEKTPENNIQIKQADQPLYDTSFEESIKNFPDMPEIEPKILKGYGIKQMPGYKCDLKIDQLNQRRDAFWSSKNKSNIVKWKIIHQACIYDHINAEELLFKNNIRTLNGCINLCIDQEGKILGTENHRLSRGFQLGLEGCRNLRGLSGRLRSPTVHRGQVTLLQVIRDFILEGC